MKLTWSDKAQRYEVLSEYEERRYPKAARFRWDAQARRWWTDDTQRAAKLIAYATLEVKQRIENVLGAQQDAIDASKATDSGVSIPVPNGLEYMPFQKAGIDYALQHRSTMLGDEMGLGKTIQVIGVINARPKIKRVLVVCPATLRLNWKRELEKWLVRPLRVGIVDCSKYPENADVVVVNYDVLKRHHDKLHGETWDLLVVDEFHYCKNRNAQRTKEVFGSGNRKTKTPTPGIKAARSICFSGTPIVNRPVYLWPVLHSIDPKTYSSFFRYAKQYCAAFRSQWGWAFTGASNLEELQLNLHMHCMLRRLKVDVL